MEALRQMRSDVGYENTLYVHVTYLPYIEASSELKTKPTQHSVRELRGIGIQPDVIIARADHEIPKEHIQKIALFCDVKERAVIPATTSDVLYSIPLLLEEEGLGEYVIERLSLTAKKPDLKAWTRMIDRIRQSVELEIAMTSSSLSGTRTIGTMGPKVSSITNSLSWGT